LLKYWTEITEVDTRTGCCFAPPARKTGQQQAMWQQDAYRIIQRRAADAGIKTIIGNHAFCATGITTYLKNKGTLEAAHHIANQKPPWTTKLCDRRQDEISLDEVDASQSKILAVIC
jgi:hypothetical protein